VILTIAWCGIGRADVIQQAPGTNFLVVEAEAFDSLEGDEATGFLLVDSSGTLTTPFGSDVLPSNTNASGGMAIYDQPGGANFEHLATWKLQFSTPGLYTPYLHFSMYEDSDEANYGGEDSFFLPLEINTIPNEADDATDGWFSFPKLGHDNPLEDPPFWEGQFHWGIPPTFENGNPMEYDMPAGTVVDFVIASRERGGALDAIVFSQDMDLSQEDLDQILEQSGGGGGGETIVIDTGIDTTLAEAGLGGPDAPHGAEGTNPDGVERWEWDGDDGGGVNHGLLWFDIPDNVLSAFGDGSATLALHINNNGNAGDLHRITSDWLSGPDGGDEVTWNNIPDGPGIVAGGNAEVDSNVQFPDSIGREGEVIEVDVTDDVRAWAAGSPNYGWGIVPIGGDGHGITSFENLDSPVPTLTLVVSSLEAALQPGDADQDFDFDQLDLVKVQIAGKYLTGAAATWGEGDWNGAPGGSQGNPPAGNGFFDQLDIIAALNANVYLTGPYAAIADGGVADDGQTSVSYNPGTGEVAVDAPAGVELTSINIDSAGGIFTGDAAQNLGGSFDNDADGNIFKATFGGSFGSLSFGNVAQTGLAKDFVLNDLTVVGSLAGGGDLGAVDLIYVPEPSSVVLALLAMVGMLAAGRRG
jgi:hypothetical protein